jgi:hypothetical protein
VLLLLRRPLLPPLPPRPAEGSVLHQRAVVRGRRRALFFEHFVLLFCSTVYVAVIYSDNLFKDFVSKLPMFEYFVQLFFTEYLVCIKMIY